MEQRVRIERLVHEGYGLGYLNGRVIFVPHVIPGEELEVEVISVRKGVQWGKIKRILVPSPQRVAPFCPNYIACGGCEWQHIAYPAQLEYKRQILEDTLMHLGGLKDIAVKPCIRSPSQRGCRSRVRLHWQDKAGLGYYRPRSHEVISIETCPLLTEGINTCLQRLSAYLRFYPLKGLNEVQMMEGTDSQVIITLLFRFWPEYHNWIKNIEEIEAAGVVVVAGDRRQTVAGWDYANIATTGWNFRVSAGAFFQANIGLLPIMMQQVVEPVESGIIGAELYSGVGVFSLPLSRKLDKLMAVEWNRRAAADALANLSANKINNIAVYALSAEDGLALLSSRNIRPDLIAADPPREGMSETVRRGILKLSPRQILYISCNPATLARDLKTLSAGNSYRLTEIQPLDMFPHTSHIETISALEPDSGFAVIPGESGRCWL